MILNRVWSFQNCCLLRLHSWFSIDRLFQRGVPYHRSYSQKCFLNIQEFHFARGALSTSCSWVHSCLEDLFHTDRLAEQFSYVSREKNGAPARELRNNFNAEFADDCLI